MEKIVLWQKKTMVLLKKIMVLWGKNYDLNKYIALDGTMGKQTMILYRKLWNFDLLWKKLWYY